ncbi:MAG TPA: class I SAM-dependent methyltransferase [Deltaproteobacteria bacterium]|nr:class I SAM-dependent methyltransferase [Deltaproteobacteria bacterium]HQI00847.1 class I SAM-dependent methyltransferase [Deltaproteobacteria bacterium]HQJ07756.1 class I SAM-dependent methyltransferase [Deltaproteobacteria bacterium]
MAEVNSTAQFHRSAPIDLMKEFTICESFARIDSPYAVALERPRSYGAMVGDFLLREGLLKKGAAVCEIGGGYGSLMQGLLSEYGHLIDRVYMLDLSKSLLKRQRKRLAPWSSKTTSIQADAHEMIGAISGIDLLIVNEVIGDLDTMTGIDPADIPEEAAEVIRAYDLDIPSCESFCLNVGAIRIVEAICRRNIPAFLTEHSSDPIIPEDMRYLERGLKLDSYPREIRLFKHSEFTIRFSHLMRAAAACGKTARTGSLLDLLPIRRTGDMRMIFTSRACSTERQEIIFELLDHIREYRWLTIT